MEKRVLEDFDEYKDLLSKLPQNIANALIEIANLYYMKGHQKGIEEGFLRGQDAQNTKTYTILKEISEKIKKSALDDINKLREKLSLSTLDQEKKKMLFELCDKRVQELTQDEPFAITSDAQDILEEAV